MGKNDVRFYAITTDGRVRLDVDSLEEARTYIASRQYLRTHATRIIRETRESFDV